MAILLLFFEIVIKVGKQEEEEEIMRTLNELIEERRRIWNDNDMWSDGLDMIVSELIQNHFKGDYKNVIDFLNSLSDTDFDMFTQFYEDFIREIPSADLLEYMYKTIEMRPGVDVKKDVEWAQEAFDNLEK